MRRSCGSRHTEHSPLPGSRVLFSNRALRNVLAVRVRHPLIRRERRTTGDTRSGASAGCCGPLGCDWDRGVTGELAALRTRGQAWCLVGCARATVGLVESVLWWRVVGGGTSVPAQPRAAPRPRATIGPAATSPPRRPSTTYRADYKPGRHLFDRRITRGRPKKRQTLNG